MKTIKAIILFMAISLSSMAVECLHGHKAYWYGEMAEDDFSSMIYVYECIWGHKTYKNSYEIGNLFADEDCEY